MIREKAAGVRPGWPPAILFSVVLLASCWGFAYSIAQDLGVSPILASVVVFLVAGFGLAGLFIVNPNEAKVVQLFGSYIGSGAVVAARTRIVEGAVGMVELALAELSKKGVIDLDEERKAAMVSNLMVVLCSDTHTQPVVNTGTLYQ